MYKYYEIVKTVFLEEIILNDGKHSERHKIEVYKNSDETYSSRIFGMERFDLIVSSEPIVASKNLYYLDNILPITEEKKFSSIDESLEFALTRIEDIYSGEKSVKDANE